MVVGRYYMGLTQFEEIRKIREEVFGQEVGYPEEINFDGLDEESVHAVVYSDKAYQEPVAAGRLHYTGGKFETLSNDSLVQYRKQACDMRGYNYEIGRVVVKKEARGCGYGDFVVRMLVDKAFQAGAEEVFAGAQPGTVPFYEKIGFVPTEDSYMEAGILYTVMRLRQSDLCKQCQAK